MSKKSFFLKLILALIPPLCLILYTYLNPFGYMDNEYPAWKFSKDVSHGKQYSLADSVITKAKTNTNYETVILGDSRAMAAIIPAEYSDSCVNLAVGGGTSIEMYYTFKNYLNNYEKPAETIIMFAPFHYSVIDNVATRTEYFNYLSYSELSELFKNAKALGSESILTKYYLSDALSYKLRMPDKYLPALLNSKGFMRYSENTAIYKDMLLNKGYGPFNDGSETLNYETNYIEMHTTGDAALLDLYLRKLLSLCAENNLNVRLLIPPMNTSSFNALNDSYVGDFQGYLENLYSMYESQFEENKLAFETEITYMEDKYFDDASHLNHDGALIYTDKIAP